jgi:hypothetical protein
MYPIGPLVGRDAISPAQLGPYCIPPGSTVHLYYHYALNDPKHWKNPHGFSPERFLSSVDPTAYVPFGVGPRGCAGCASLCQSIPHVKRSSSPSLLLACPSNNSCKYLTIHVVMRRVHELTFPRTRLGNICQNISLCSGKISAISSVDNVNDIPTYNCGYDELSACVKIQLLSCSISCSTLRRSMSL